MRGVASTRFKTKSPILDVFWNSFADRLCCNSRAFVVSEKEGSVSPQHAASVSSNITVKHLWQAGLLHTKQLQSLNVTLEIKSVRAVGYVSFLWVC